MPIRKIRVLVCDNEACTNQVEIPDRRGISSFVPQGWLRVMFSDHDDNRAHLRLCPNCWIASTVGVGPLVAPAQNEQDASQIACR